MNVPVAFNSYDSDVPNNNIVTVWDKESLLYKTLFSNFTTNLTVDWNIFNGLNKQFKFQADSISFAGIGILTDSVTILLKKILGNPQLQVFKPFNINVEFTPDSQKIVYFIVLVNNLTSGSTKKIGFSGKANFQSTTLSTIYINAITLLDETIISGVSGLTDNLGVNGRDDYFRL
jgi:hypothetical protein